MKACRHTIVMFYVLYHCTVLFCTLLSTKGLSSWVNACQHDTFNFGFHTLLMPPVGPSHNTISTSRDLFPCCITATQTSCSEKGPITLSLSNKSVFRFHHDLIPLSQHNTTTVMDRGSWPSNMTVLCSSRILLWKSISSSFPPERPA